MTRVDVCHAFLNAQAVTYEIAAGHVLAPFFGTSLLTWTTVIATVLGGFSLGSAIGGLVAERPRAVALGADGSRSGPGALRAFRRRWLVYATHPRASRTRGHSRMIADGLGTADDDQQSDFVGKRICKSWRIWSDLSGVNLG